jgi:hypothetical protein
MISMHRVACVFTSASQEPSGQIGAVPDTITRSPTRTALEKPTMSSNGDPDLVLDRAMTPAKSAP